MKGATPEEVEAAVRIQAILVVLNLGKQQRNQDNNDNEQET